ncbi:hypothetical protein F4810DRAFT_664585 [Camillea tinctor]|nr:hypothetical protein F4810DRAFT_664585 [Camillea tinctor]
MYIPRGNEPTIGLQFLSLPLLIFPTSAHPPNPPNPPIIHLFIHSSIDQSYIHHHTPFSSFIPNSVQNVKHQPQIASYTNHTPERYCNSFLNQYYLPPSTSSYRARERERVSERERDRE